MSETLNQTKIRCNCNKYRSTFVYIYNLKKKLLNYCNANNEITSGVLCNTMHSYDKTLTKQKPLNYVNVKENRSLDYMLPDRIIMMNELIFAIKNSVPAYM